MSLLHEWLTAALFFFGCLMLLLGVGLVLAPNRMIAASRALDRWVSTERFFRRLDQPHSVERLIYHYHRLAGVLITAAGAYVLFVFSNPGYRRGFALLFPDFNNPLLAGWLYDALLLILLLVSAAAVVVGVVIAVRPSALKRLEGVSNIWVDTNEPLQSLDREHHIPAHILPGNVRLFGTAVSLGALYVVVRTGVALFSG